MADTTTPILSLTKPSTVAPKSTNTWGTKWNDNFDDIDALFELSGGDPVLKQSKGGTGAKTAAVALTNLGGSTVGKALFTAASATAACAQLEAASPARFAVIEQATSDSETDLEIGSWIFCSVAAGAPVLNSSVAPRLQTGTTVYTTSGSGTLLTGTWRARGSLDDTGGTPRKAVLQRVA